MLEAEEEAEREEAIARVAALEVAEAAEREEHARLREAINNLMNGASAVHDLHANAAGLAHVMDGAQAGAAGPQAAQLALEKEEREWAQYLHKQCTDEQLIRLLRSVGVEMSRRRMQVRLTWRSLVDNIYVSETGTFVKEGAPVRWARYQYQLMPDQSTTTRYGLSE